MPKPFNVSKRKAELEQLQRNSETMCQRAAHIAGELCGRDGTKKLERAAARISDAFLKVQNISIP